MQHIIQSIRSLQRQADEYAGMGLDFPTSGVGALQDQLRFLLADAEQQAGQVNDAQSVPECQTCAQPYGPDPAGSPGVLVHLTADGDVDHDRDRDHVPLPAEE
ncbi:hypothetical protein GCM10008959_31640 [Deinococcus seoulensis]|uniref:Uncharacterized protein n=1 Tax=Deinococcus seoulensis TaxID=1837379 RepID=A0ABQ2RWP7_9DEIO|nr:hypothetical protein [Deinococcus seoulensis]GGR67136.1 hypothetical protein GCM10008959_31640 [Deinococcus seoulensis]